MGLVLGLICIVILIHLVVEYIIRKIKESKGQPQSTARDGETNNSVADATSTSSMIDIEDIIEKSSICMFIFLILTHFNFFSLFASARVILFLQDFLTLLRGSFMIPVYIYVRNPHLRNFAWDTMMGKRKLVNVQNPNEMQLHPIV
jgi:hypothetical protein